MSINSHTNIFKDGIKNIMKRVGNNIRNERPVRLGHPNGAIYVDENRTLIYVRGQGNDTSSLEIISSSNLKTPDVIYDKPLLLRQIDNNDWVVSGIDSKADVQYSAGIVAQPDLSPVKLSQLDYGTLQPYNGLVLQVLSAIYGNDYVGDRLTGDFATGTVQDTSAANIVVPTTNNRAIGVLVQVTPSTGLLSYKQSVEFNASISLPQAYNSALLPLPDDNARRVGYFKLIKGVTSLNPSHILVVPDFLGDRGALWTNPIVSALEIALGFQQHAIEQTISTNGELTVSGEYFVDNTLIISGGELIISGGTVVIRNIPSENASLVSNSISITSNYTVQLNDGNIFVDASAGDVTIDLPVVATVIGRSFRVLRRNLSGGNVIVDGNGSETINGDLTQTITQQYTGIIFVAGLTDWGTG